MPSREFLLKGLEDKAVQANLDYQIGLAVLLGVDPERASKEQTLAAQFEINLANVFCFYNFTYYFNIFIKYFLKLMQISLPSEERRDVIKLYNPMTIKELSKTVPQVPWLDYMNTILAPYHVLTEDERVIVDVPNYFQKLADLLAKTTKRFANIFINARVSNRY